MQNLFFFRRLTELVLHRKFLGKGSQSYHQSLSKNFTEYFIGYKVGRVDQAETALGAEMRMAADKSKGKVSEGKGTEKIVRRFVSFLLCFVLIILLCA